MKRKGITKKRSGKKVDKKGMPPGSVVFTGDRKMENTHVHFVRYNEASLEAKEYGRQIQPEFNIGIDGKVTWYDIRGVHDTELIEAIGKQFSIHPLVLEDIADTQQRPKFDEYENGVFIIAKALQFNPITIEIQTEQVAIFVSKSIVFSFQEDEEDLFAGVRDRVDTGRGKIRKRGADYLAYALLDNIVDQYFDVLDRVEEEIEKLEAEIIKSPRNDSKARNHNLKREMLTVRKAVQPLREAISKFAKSESPFVAETTEIFLRDLYDHTIQVMDMVETYRDVLTGLQDLYLSEISYKMNQIMQVLTVISTIFIPLSFLTGVYGMNFENMPELKTQNGYFILLGVMATIVISLLFYFRKNRWV
jgi:magnesium transporter